ncbi:MAG: hypothetical protein JNM24_15445 [Bdellovibrionaceae bacterium]|nr:hypothetical protein [Pseudobdellovibrionaceae bacterium]
MSATYFEGFPVVAYDLAAYESMLKPFCDFMLSAEGEKFTLGDDYETDRVNIWDLDIDAVRLMSAVFDTHCLQYLEEMHPKYKGKKLNYVLEKDAWLTTPETKQHVRIHNHLPPFIRAEDAGELITVFYVHLDETINMNNGPLELFHSPDLKPAHIWLPKTYNLILMTPQVWHRARPFTGKRYSLATDIKVRTA